MNLATVLILLVLGAGLLLLGLWGRSNAESLARVPGMVEELQQRRTSVMKRGATTCAVVGLAFVLLGVVAPLLPQR